MKKLLLFFFLFFVSCQNTDIDKSITVPEYLDKNSNKICDHLEQKILENNYLLISDDDKIEVIVALKTNTKLDKYKHLYKSSKLKKFAFLQVNKDDIYDIANTDDVIFVEENKKVQINLMNSTKQIGARDVWAEGYTGDYIGGNVSKPVRLAVIDTGIDIDHQDFENQVYKSLNCFDADECYLVTENNDDHSHGTHVAGIVLGTGASQTEVNKVFFEYKGNFTSTNNTVFSYFPVQFKDSTNPENLSAKITWLGKDESGFEFYTKSAIDAAGSNFFETYDEKVDTSLSVTDSVDGSSGDLTPSSASNLILPYALSIKTKNSSMIGKPYYAQVKTIAQGWNDALPLMAGVSHGSQLVSLKALDANGSGSILDIIKALEYINNNAVQDKIIAVNLSFSLGTNLVSVALDTVVNSVIDNGVVVVVSAGNSQGVGTIASPGLSDKAITVGAVNDKNQVSNYTSTGYLYTNKIKPDLVAPGGSLVTRIYNAAPKSTHATLSLWNKNNLGSLQDPYTLKVGTSQAAPHVTGLIGLMANKWEGSWTYGSSVMPLFFKMLLCMTAYEVGASESGAVSVGLPERAGGLSDVVEGHGMISAQGALSSFNTWDVYLVSASNSFTFGDELGAVKTFARKINLQSIHEYNFFMNVPNGSDYDLYLFKGEPDAIGNPILLASSALSNNTVERIIDFIPEVTGTYYIVAKHVSGAGTTNIQMNYYKVAPVNKMEISNLKFIKNMKNKNIKVNWTTNYPALSTLQYGNSGGLGLQLFSSEYKTNHEFEFDIEYDNNYYFRAVSSSHGVNDYEISTATSKVYKADAHTVLAYNPLPSDLPNIDVGGCGLVWESKATLPTSSYLFMFIFIPFGFLLVIRLLIIIKYQKF